MPDRDRVEHPRVTLPKNLSEALKRLEDAELETLLREVIAETERRRTRQAAYNVEHGITPESVVRDIDDVMSSVYERDYVTVPADEPPETFRTHAELEARVTQLHAQMKAAAANLEFEKAATLRDRIKHLKTRELGLVSGGRR